MLQKFLLTLPFVFSSEVLASDITIDLPSHNRCDSIYRPAGCRPIGESDGMVKRDLSLTVGINLVVNSKITPLPNQVFRIPQSNQNGRSAVARNPRASAPTTQPDAAPTGEEMAAQQPSGGQTQAASAQGSGPAAQASQGQGHAPSAR